MQPWAERIRQVIAESDAAPFVVSDLVRLECRVVPLRNGDSELLGRFETVFAAAEFARFTPAVFDRAAELRAYHRIKTPDALHLAAAIEHGCDEFWTNDDRLASIRAQIAVRAFK
jgi:uncharacterized protein